MPRGPFTRIMAEQDKRTSGSGSQPPATCPLPCSPTVVARQPFISVMAPSASSMPRPLSCALCYNDCIFAFAARFSGAMDLDTGGCNGLGFSRVHALIARHGGCGRRKSPAAIRSRLPDAARQSIIHVHWASSLNLPRRVQATRLISQR
jgi:hypothetical protein